MNEIETATITADEYRILEGAIRSAINLIDRYAEPLEADITQKNGISGDVGQELDTAARVVEELGKRLLIHR